MDGHAGFDYSPIIVANRLGDIMGQNIKVGFAADLVALNTMTAFKFAVNQKVTKPLAEEDGQKLLRVVIESVRSSGQEPLCSINHLIQLFNRMSIIPAAER